MDWKGRLVGASALGILASSSHACLLLSVFARPQVGLVRQSNIVIWDPATKIEHLVRSSAFLSNTKKFDIVTPTPTIPTVKPVKYHSFMSLFRLMHPAPPEFPPLGDSFGLMANGQSKYPSDTPKVEVAQIAKVGNLVATTIQASDVIALADWLKKNGYKPNEAQNKWLENYVQKRWYLTAFKVETGEQVFETDAVRLSFQTDVPMSPYYTPPSSWLKGVWQEVYVVSPVQLHGYVGPKDEWKAKVDGHAYITTDARKALSDELGLVPGEIPERSWVQRYLETSPATNTTDDIYFFPQKKDAKRIARK